MKKISLIFIIMFVFSAGCTNKEKMTDYFPYYENTTLHYEGTGNEYASYVAYTDYLDTGRIQMRINNGGTEMTKVYEITDNKISLIYQEEEFYHREKLIDRVYSNEEILLMEPLKKGTQWILPDGRTRAITATRINIDTPIGEFKAIEVTTINTDSISKDYYAAGIGHIKSVFIAKDYEVSSSLETIDPQTSWDQVIKVYYPNINDERFYFIDQNISFHTNDSIEDAFEYLLKTDPPEGFGALLGNNVEIMSIDRLKDNSVHIDFSKEFIREMNAGANFEGMILQSVVNTIGDYYRVEQVLLTIEGAPYSSGHFEFAEGEKLSVDHTNIQEVIK